MAGTMIARFDISSVAPDFFSGSWHMVVGAAGFDRLIYKRL
jgi:hypothetical protein